MPENPLELGLIAGKKLAPTNRDNLVGGTSFTPTFKSDNKERNFNIENYDPRLVDFNELQAANQSTGDIIANGILQGTETFASAIAQGGVVLGSLAAAAFRPSSYDGHFTDNVLRNSVMQGINEFDKMFKEDVAPIYHSKYDDEHITTKTLYESLINGAGFLASIFVPLGIIGKGVSKLGELGKYGRALGLAEATSTDAQAAAKLIGKIKVPKGQLVENFVKAKFDDLIKSATSAEEAALLTKQSIAYIKYQKRLETVGSIVGQSYSRLGESSMESYQTYDQLRTELQRKKDNGEIDANVDIEAIAKEQANNVFMFNMALAIPEYAQYNSLFGKYLGKNITKNFDMVDGTGVARKLSKWQKVGKYTGTVAKNFGFEAEEELFQYGLQEAAKEIGNNQAIGVKNENSFFTTAVAHNIKGLSTHEGQLSGLVGGLLGGGISSVTTLGNNKRYEQASINNAKIFNNYATLSEEYHKLEDLDKYENNAQGEKTFKKDYLTKINNFTKLEELKKMALERNDQISYNQFNELQKVYSISSTVLAGTYDETLQNIENLANESDETINKQFGITEPLLDINGNELSPQQIVIQEVAKIKEYKKIYDNLVNSTIFGKLSTTARSEIFFNLAAQQINNDLLTETNNKLNEIEANGGVIFNEDKEDKSNTFEKENGVNYRINPIYSQQYKELLDQKDYLEKENFNLISSYRDWEKDPQTTDYENLKRAIQREKKATGETTDEDLDNFNKFKKENVGKEFTIKKATGILQSEDGRLWVRQGNRYVETKDGSIGHGAAIASIDSDIIKNAIPTNSTYDLKVKFDGTNFVDENGNIHNTFEHFRGAALLTKQSEEVIDTTKNATADIQTQIELIAELTDTELIEQLNNTKIVNAEIKKALENEIKSRKEKSGNATLIKNLIAKIKNYLKNTEKEILSKEEILVYLNEILLDATDKIDSISKEVFKQLQDYKNIRRPKNTKGSLILKERIEQQQQEVRKLFEVANDIKNRINEVESELNKLQELSKDLTHRINYYNSVIADNNYVSLSKEEIESKKEVLKNNLDKVNTIIDRTRVFINKLKDILKDVINFVKKALGNYEKLQNENSKLELSIAGLKEYLDKNDNFDANYLALKEYVFDKVEKDLLNKLDHEEINREILEKNEKLLEQLTEKAILLQTQIRFLEDLTRLFEQTKQDNKEVKLPVVEKTSLFDIINNLLRVTNPEEFKNKLQAIYNIREKEFTSAQKQMLKDRYNELLKNSNYKNKSEFDTPPEEPEVVESNDSEFDDSLKKQLSQIVNSTTGRNYEDKSDTVLGKLWNRIAYKFAELVKFGNDKYTIQLIRPDTHKQWFKEGEDKDVIADKKAKGETDFRYFKGLVLKNGKPIDYKGNEITDNYQDAVTVYFHDEDYENVIIPQGIKAEKLKAFKDNYKAKRLKIYEAINADSVITVKILGKSNGIPNMKFDSSPKKVYLQLGLAKADDIDLEVATIDTINGIKVKKGAVYIKTNGHIFPADTRNLTTAEIETIFQAFKIFVEKGKDAVIDKKSSTKPFDIIGSLVIWGKNIYYDKGSNILTFDFGDGNIVQMPFKEIDNYRETFERYLSTKKIQVKNTLINENKSYTYVLIDANGVTTAKYFKSYKDFLFGEVGEENRDFPLTTKITLFSENNTQADDFQFKSTYLNTENLTDIADNLEEQKDVVNPTEKAGSVGVGGDVDNVTVSTKDKNFNKEEFVRDIDKLEKEKKNGSKNIGLYSFKDKFVKVVKSKRKLSKEDLNRLRDRVSDIDNVYPALEIIDLPNGSQAIVMDKASGKIGNELTQKEIDNIPQEHWDKFEQTIRELSKRGVQTDLTKRSNVLYDKDKGFQFIDLEGASIEGDATNKFFKKDGKEYYYNFEKYTFFPKEYKSAKEIFTDIKQESVEKSLKEPVEDIKDLLYNINAMFNSEELIASINKNIAHNPKQIYNYARNIIASLSNRRDIENPKFKDLVVQAITKYQVEYNSKNSKNTKIADLFGIVENPVEPTNGVQNDNADVTSEPFDDGLGDFRLINGKIVNKEDFEKLKKWWASRIPLDFSIVRRIINGNAQGVFGKNGVKIWEGAEIGTGFHEAFHVVFSLFMTPSQIKAIFNEFKTKYKGKTLLNYKGESKLADNFSNKEIEEYLAEQFREYVLGKEEKAKEWNFFTRLWDFIKNWVKYYVNNDSGTRQLFEKINTGYYYNKQFINSYEGEDKPSLLNKEDSTFKKQINEGINYLFWANFFNDGHTIRKIVDGEVKVREVFESLFGKLAAQPNKTEHVKWILNNKEKVTENYANYLKNYFIKVNFDKEDLLEDEDLEETATTDFAYDKIDIEFSGRKTMSTEIKLLILSNIVKREEDGKYFVNPETGLKEGVSFKDTYDFLTNILAGQTSLDKMVEIIRNFSKYRPELNGILRRLDLDNVNPDLDAQQLQTLFTQNFSKQKIEILINLNSSNDSYFVEGTIKNLRDKIRNNWKNSLKTSDTIKVVGKQRLIDTDKLVTDDEGKTFLVTNYETAIMFLNQLGVKFSQQIDDLDIQKEIIEQARNLQAFKESVNPDKFYSDTSKSRVNKLIDIEIENNFNNYELSFNGLEGKPEYSVINNDYLSLVVNAIDRKDKEELSNFPYLNGIFAKSSIVIKEARRIISVIIRGTREQQSGANGIPTSKLSYGGKLAIFVNALMNGITPNIKESDKSLNRGFKFGEPFFEYKNTDNIDLYWDYFKSQLETELALINLKTVENIKNYNKNNKEFRLFDFLLEGLQDELKEKGLTADNEGRVKAALEEYLENGGEQLINELKAEQLIMHPTNGAITNMRLDGAFIKKNNINTPDDYRRLGKYLFAQNVLGNLEIQKLFMGDIAFHANFEAVIKRNSANSGTKTFPNVTKKFNDWFNTNYKRLDGKIETNELKYVVLEDVKVDFDSEEFKKYDGTDIYANIVKYIEEKLARDYATKSIEKTKEQINKEALVYAEKYKDIDTTDGFSWILPDKYRSLMMRLAKWNNKAEAAWQKAIKGEKTDYPFPQEKLQFFHLQAVGELAVPTYFKFSVKPLFLSQVQGTQLEIAYKTYTNTTANLNNTKNTADLLLFDSAVKSGRIGTLSKMGEVHNIQITNVVGLGVQVENNVKTNNKINKVTQMDAQLLGHLYQNGKPINDFAKALLEKIKSIKDSITQINIKELEEDLGINATGHIVDKKKFIDFVTEKVTTRELAENTIEAVKGLFDAHKDKLYPIDILTISQQVEPVIQSVFNHVIKYKRSGFQLVEAPFYGLEKKEDSKLKFYRFEDGKIKGIQVMLPAMYKGQVSLGKHNKLIGARIPVQGLNSVEFIEVMGFTEGIDANTVYIPDGLTTKSGTDFDFDKLSIYLPYLNNKDEYKEYYPEPTKEQEEELFNDYLNSKLKHNNEVKKLKNRLTLEEGLLKETDADDIFTAMFAEYGTNKKGKEVITNDRLSNYSLETKIIVDKIKATLSGILEKETLIAKQEFDNKSIEEKNGFERLNNSLLETYLQVIQQPELYGDLLLPNNSKQISDLAEKMRDLKGKKVSNKLSDIFNIVKMVRQAFINDKAKENVASAAANLKNHLLCQIAGVYIEDIDLSIFKGHNIIEVAIEEEAGTRYQEYVSLADTTNIEGHKIVDILSELLTSFVDATKDPFVFDIHALKEILDVFYLLIRTGVPLNEVVYFMNQPIIEKVVKEVQRDSYLKNQSFNTSAKKIIDTNIKELESYIEKNKQFIDEKETLSNQTSIAKYGHYIKQGMAVLHIQPTKETVEFARKQLIYLETFKNLSTKHSSEIFKLTQSFNQDTKGADKTLALTKRNNKALTDLTKSGYFGNIDKLFEITDYGELRKFIESIPFRQREIYLSEKPEVKQVMEDILSYYDYASADEYQKIANIAKKNFITWLIYKTKTKFGDGVELKTELTKLLGGEQSIVSLFAKIKNDAKHSSLLDNKLIRDLYPILSDNLDATDVNNTIGQTNINNLILYNRVLENIDSDEYTNAWRELYDNIKTQRLAKALIKLSIVQSGFNSSPFSFHQYIPHELFEEIYKEVLDKYEDNIGQYNMGEFFNEFFKNNTDKSNIVPRVPSDKASYNDGVFSYKYNYPFIMYVQQDGSNILLEQVGYDGAKSYKYQITPNSRKFIGVRQGEVSLQKWGNGFIKFKEDYDNISFDDVLPVIEADAKTSTETKSNNNRQTKLFGLDLQNQGNLEFHINTLNVVSQFLQEIGVEQRLISKFLQQDGSVIEGALAAANFLEGTVDIIEDFEKRPDAWNKLPEEAAHWWYRLLKGNTQLKQALWNNHKTYIKTNQLLDEDYANQNPETLSEEAIGQLIAESIKRISESKGNLEDYSFFKKFLEWINSILAKFKKLRNDPFEVAAMKILSSDMTDLMSWEEYRKLNNIVNFADVLTEQSVAPIDYSIIDDIGLTEFNQFGFSFIPKFVDFNNSNSLRQVTFNTKEELDNWIATNIPEHNQRQKDKIQEVRDNQAFFDRLLNKTFRKRSKFLPKTLAKYYTIIDSQNLNNLNEWHINQDLQKITKKLSEQEKEQIVRTNGYTNIAPTLKVLPDILKKYAKQPIVLSEPIKIDGAKKQELAILNGIRELIKFEQDSTVHGKKTITSEEFVNEAHNWLETNYLLGFANEKSYLSYRTDQTFSYLSDRQSNEDVDITNMTEEELQRLPFEERQRIANIVGLTKQNPDVYHNKVSLRFNDSYHEEYGQDANHFAKRPSAWGNLTYFYTGKNKWKDAVLLHEIQNDNIEHLKELNAEKVDLDVSLNRYLQQLNINLQENIQQIESGGKKIQKTYIAENIYGSYNKLNTYLVQFTDMPFGDEVTIQNLNRFKETINEQINLFKSGGVQNSLEVQQKSLEAAYANRRLWQSFIRNGGLKSILSSNDLMDLKEYIQTINVDTENLLNDNESLLKQKKQSFYNKASQLSDKINSKIIELHGRTIGFNFQAPAKPLPKAQRNMRTVRGVRTGGASNVLNDNIDFLIAFNEKQYLNNLSKQIEETKKAWVFARNATVANNFNEKLVKITLEQYANLLENYKYNRDLLNKLVDIEAQKKLQEQTIVYTEENNKTNQIEIHKKQFDNLMQDALLKKEDLERDYGKIEEEVKQVLEVEMNYFTPLVHHLIQKHIQQYGKDFPMYFSGFNITKLTQGNDRTALIYAGKEEVNIVDKRKFEINGKKYERKFDNPISLSGSVLIENFNFVYSESKNSYKKVRVQDKNGEIIPKGWGVETIYDGTSKEYADEYNNALKEYEKAYQQATERKAKEIKYQAAQQIGLIPTKTTVPYNDVKELSLEEGIKKLNEYKKQSKQNLDRIINTIMNISGNKPIETGALYNAMSQVSGVKLIWKDSIKGLQSNVGGYLVDLSNYNYNTPILYGLQKNENLINKEILESKEFNEFLISELEKNPNAKDEDILQQFKNCH